MPRKGAVAELATLPLTPKPTREEVPEWSEATTNALDALSILERKVVEWTAAGCCNAAEAYRRATGTEYISAEKDHTRKNGQAILSRPRVQKALSLAMQDMGFEARLDRLWMLQRLEAALAKTEECEGAYAQEVAAGIVEKIAKLKGEITKKHEITGDGLSKRSDVHIFILETIAKAKGLESIREDEDSGQPVTKVVITPDATVGADQLSTSNCMAE